ncbi:hypothetical protein JCM13304A_08590 [Desulfothermus okinawensis JCM 13304]
MSVYYNPKKLCIWSIARVIREVECKNGFDCYTCILDKALNKIANTNELLKKQGIPPKGRKGRIVHWKQNLLSLEPNKRPCIYSIKNKTPFRPCMNDYDCPKCEFNQYFEDVYSVYAEIDQISEMKVKGFKFPHGYYLSKYHTWMKLGNGSTVIIGMDEFVSRLFGPFSEIKPPVLGKKITKGKKHIFLKKSDKMTYLCAPVSGIVLDVNPDVWEGKLKKDNPYTKGWIIKVQATSLATEIKDLMFEEEVLNFLSQEVDLFLGEVEKTYGALAADGGNLIEDIFTKAPQLDWDFFSRKFLRYND